MLQSQIIKIAKFSAKIPCNKDYKDWISRSSKATPPDLHAQFCSTPACSLLLFWSYFYENILIMFIKYVLFYFDSHDCMFHSKKMKTFIIVNKQNDCLKLFCNLLISSAHLMPSRYKSLTISKE